MPVAPIEPKEIEREKVGRAFFALQIGETGPPFGIKAHDLSINDRITRGHIPNEMFSQFREPAEDIAIFRNKIASAVNDIRQRSKAIVFQFENPIRIIEWRASGARQHGSKQGNRFHT